MAPRDAGATLVEMLVVLAIVAVASGATVLAMGRSASDGDLDAEARRLAVRLTAAADEAMTSGRAQTLEWDAAGYRLRPSEPSGQPAQHGDRLARHQLPRSMHMSGQTQAPLIDADGAASPFSLRLVSGSRVAAVQFDGLQGHAGGMSH